MFCERSLGKVNDKDLELFQNKLVHKFYWLESRVDYFGTSVNTSVVIIVQIARLTGQEL